MSRSKGTVVVTGGTRGLGRELSLLFGANGYQISALYKSNQEAAEALKQEFTEKNVDGFCLKCDLANDNIDAGQIVPKSDTPRIILINNAATEFSLKPIHLTEWQDFQSQIDVSLKGSFHCFKALAKKMSATKQSLVINVLSSAIAESPKGFGPYTAAKASVEALGRSIGVEYAAVGIRVFSVAPGFMGGGVTRGWDERSKHQLSLSSKMALRRDVAQWVYELTQNTTLPGRGEVYEQDNAIILQGADDGRK